MERILITIDYMTFDYVIYCDIPTRFLASIITYNDIIKYIRTRALRLYFKYYLYIKNIFYFFYFFNLFKGYIISFARPIK